MVNDTTCGQFTNKGNSFFCSNMNYCGAYSNFLQSLQITINGSVYNIQPWDYFDDGAEYEDCLCYLYVGASSTSFSPSSLILGTTFFHNFIV